MGRLTPPTGQLSPEQQALCDHLVATRGWLPEVFAVGLHSSELMRRIAEVGTYFRLESILDPHLRELAILSVAVETESIYEWTHHVEPARAVGIADEMLERLASGVLANDPGVIGAVVRFARAVAAGVEVDAETFELLRRELGEAGVYELTILAGFYLLQARTVDLLGVRIEPGIEPRPFRPGHGAILASNKPISR